MKAKHLLWSLLALWLLCPMLKVQAQGYERVTFYGVDYSKARAFGAEESVDAFRKALSGVNQLFISEQKKYNVAKVIDAEEVTYQISHGAKTAEKLTGDFLEGTQEYQLTRSDLEAVVKRIKVESDDHYGMVMVAELLDKPQAVASYHVVIFNQSNKEIVEVTKTTGKAKGFGLRNYWARTVLESLKSLR